MYKWLLILLITFLYTTSASAESKVIKFVYIHGSNFNSECLKELFIKQTNQLHKEIIKQLKLRGSETAISDHLLKSGEYNISTKPLAFYWGDLPKPEVDFLEKQLELTEGTSFVAQKARNLISTVLHDAVWLEKSSRRAEVMDRLVEELQGNENFVLLGHSGGSLVAYQFINQRISFLNLEDYCHGIAINELFLNQGSSEDKVIAKIDASMKVNFQKCIQDSARFQKLMNMSENYICTDGAAYIGLVKIDPRLSSILQPNVGELLKELENNPRKVENTQQLLSQTCVGKERLKGLITFGSPIPVFGSVYMSQIYNPQKTLSKRYQFIDSIFEYYLKYIYNSGGFWLHINHLDDAIGVAIDDKKLMSIASQQNTISKTKSGFIFSTNSFFQKYFKGEKYLKPQRFLNLKEAHLWYWNKPREFAHFLVQTYIDGFHFSGYKKSQ